MPVIPSPKTIDALIDQAMTAAAREYSGQGAGGVSGGTGGAAGKNSVLRRFTKTNTHGFAPLSKDYAAAKSRKGLGGKPILVRTGDLVRAVRSTGMVRRGGDVWFIRWSLPDYGEYVNDGTTRMPPRPVVEPNAVDRDAFKARVRHYLRQLMQRARSASRSKPPA